MTFDEQISLNTTKAGFKGVFKTLPSKAKPKPQRLVDITNIRFPLNVRVTIFKPNQKMGTISTHTNGINFVFP